MFQQGRVEFTEGQCFWALVSADQIINRIISKGKTKRWWSRKGRGECFDNHKRIQQHNQIRLRSLRSRGFASPLHLNYISVIRCDLWDAHFLCTILDDTHTAAGEISQSVSVKDQPCQEPAKGTRSLLAEHRDLNDIRQSRERSQKHLPLDWWQSESQENQWRVAKGSEERKEKTRGTANLLGVAIKKPTLNYGSALPLFQYIHQYIMHMAVFQNAWNTGGALESMIYGSHVICYLLVIITADC